MMDPNKEMAQQPAPEARSKRLRQRHEQRLGNAPRGRRSGRALLMWGGVGLVALFIVALIAAPLVYRSLRPQYRESIKHRLPFMAVFDPQREYQADALPTVAAQNGDGVSAADLLLTPEASPEAGGGVVIDPTDDPPQEGQPMLPTPNEDMLIIITATPSPVPTEAPTMIPTEVEAVEAQPTDIPPTDVPPTATLPPPTPAPPTAV
ncbi:MAG: hypothetical protein JXN59_05425, partial [Anaerolineae bacterium]|nr:hypothetical protein [Anaerolineae bacterium]